MLSCKYNVAFPSWGVYFFFSVLETFQDLFGIKFYDLHLTKGLLNKMWTYEFNIFRLLHFYVPGDTRNTNSLLFLRDDT